MKSRLLTLAATVVLTLIGSGALHAQGSVAPSSQFGIGVNTEGLAIQYALSPAMHIGLMTTLASQSDSSTSTTFYGIAPYFRFLLEGTVNPFFDAGISISKASSGGFTGSTTSIFASFGLEYFINRNVGVFGAVQVLDLQIDPSPTVTTFGFFSPRVGVEWFFDR